LQLGVERGEGHRRVPKARHGLRLRAEFHYHESRQALPAGFGFSDGAGDDERGIVLANEADQFGRICG
jgi:hypothetical protein